MFRRSFPRFELLLVVLWLLQRRPMREGEILGELDGLRRAVRDHQGREVKSLGDGLMVVFGSARAAVACSLAMQRACQHPLQLRIGMAAGETVREEDDYFGRPVIVARRLCDAARGGQVLVSDPTRGLVAGAAAHQLQPVGPLVLKGLSEPVAVGAIRLRPLALSA